MVKYFFSSGSFPPPIAGGSIQYVYNIVSNLPSNQVVVHTGITSGSSSRDFDKDLRFRVIRSNFVRVVIGHRSMGKYFAKLNVLFIEYFIRPIITLFWIIRLNPKTIIFTEICFTSACILLLNRFIRKPIILFAYGEELTKLGVHPLHKRWLRYSIRRSMAIISVSEFTNGLLGNLGANVVKIYKLLPTVGLTKVKSFTEEELSGARNELNLNGKLIILTVARLERRKNHELILRAMPSIMESIPNVTYVILGGGHLREELEKLVVDLNIEDSVKFAGVVDEELLSRYYRLAHLFILPHIELPETNDTEGCPTVFFEACANGLPVISGQAGGVKDVILEGFNGLTVSGNSTIELKEKVLEIFSNDKLKLELINNGYEVAKNNTPEKSAQRFIEICNDLSH